MEQMWINILEYSEFRGEYLFMAPVCKTWYQIGKTRGYRTGVAEIMRSTSTILESNMYPKGRKLLRNYAWSYIAQNIKDDIEKVATLIQSIVPWDPFSVCIAGKYENVNFILWLRNTHLKWDPAICLASAALEGNLYFMQKLYQYGYTPQGTSSKTAAVHGSIELLRWLKTINCDMEDVTQHLAEEGHLNTLIWANNNGIPCDDQTLDAAAHGGHVDVVRYLVIDKKIDPIESTLQAAAYGGNRVVLEFLRGRYPELYHPDLMDIWDFL